MPMKQCADCGGWFDAEAFFRRDTPAYAYAGKGRRSTCLACEQTARDAQKTTNRWPTKIRDTIRRHAVRLGVDGDVLQTRYGWDFARMMHEAQHAYDNG